MGDRSVAQSSMHLPARTDDAFGALDDASPTQGLEIMVRKAKEGLNGALFAMSKRGSDSRVLTYFTMILDGLQMCAFVLPAAELMDFGYPDAVASFANVLSYSLIAKHLTTAFGVQTMVIIFLVLVALELTNLVYVMYAWANQQFRHVWAIRLLRSTMTFMAGLMFIPIVSVLSNVFVCRGIEDEALCSGLLPVTIIECLGFVLTAILVAVSLFDPHIVSSAPSARPHSRITTLHLFSKVTFAMLFQGLRQPVPSDTLRLAWPIFTTVWSILLAFLMTWYQPYYSRFTTSLRALLSNVLAWIAVCNLLHCTIFWHSERVSPLALIMFGGLALVVPLTPVLVDYRRHKLLATDVDKCANVYELELKCRFYLQGIGSGYIPDLGKADRAVASERAATVNRWYMEGEKRFARSSILAVFNAHILMDLLPERVALVRRAILVARKRGTGLDTAFQVFKLNRLVEEGSSSSGGADVLSYVRSEKYLREALAQDELCVKQLIRFWNELSERRPDASKIRNLSLSIAKSSANAYQAYRSLIEASPASAKAHNLFSGFLTDVMNNTAAGRAVAAKAMRLHKTKNQSKGAASLDNIHSDSVGLVIVNSGIKSGHVAGEIVSANEHACSVLNVPSQALVGADVDMLLLPPLHKRFQEIVTRFIDDGDDRIFDTVLRTFVRSGGGVAVEVDMKLKAYVADDSLSIYVLFTAIQGGPEFILMTPDNRVAGLSRVCSSAFYPCADELQEELATRGRAAASCSKVFDNYAELSQGSATQTRSAVLRPAPPTLGGGALLHVLTRAEETRLLAMPKDEREPRVLLRCVTHDMLDSSIIAVQIADSGGVSELQRPRAKGGYGTRGNGIGDDDVDSDCDVDSTGGFGNDDDDDDDDDDGQVSGATRPVSPVAKRTTLAAPEGSRRAPRRRNPGSVGGSDTGSSVTSQEALRNKAQTVRRQLAASSAGAMDPVLKRLLRLYLVVCVVVCTIIYLKYRDSTGVLDAFQANVVLLNGLGLRRFCIVTFAYSAHSLNLVNKGVLGPEWEAKARKELVWAADKLKTIDTKLFNRRGGIGGRLQAIYEEPEVIFSSMQNGELQLEKMGLYDAVLTLTTVAEQAASISAEEYTETDPVSFMLMGNLDGVQGSPLHALEETTDLFTNHTASSLDTAVVQFRESTFILVGGIALVILITLYPLVGNGGKIERVKSEILDVFRQIPTTTTRSLAARYEARLAIVHGSGESATSPMHRQTSFRNDHNNLKSTPSANTATGGGGGGGGDSSLALLAPRLPNLRSFGGSEDAGLVKSNSKSSDDFSPHKPGAGAGAGARSAVIKPPRGTASVRRLEEGSEQKPRMFSARKLRVGLKLSSLLVVPIINGGLATWLLEEAQVDTLGAPGEANFAGYRRMKSRYVSHELRMWLTGGLREPSAAGMFRHPVTDEVIDYAAHADDVRSRVAELTYIHTSLLYGTPQFDIPGTFKDSSDENQLMMDLYTVDGCINWPADAAVDVDTCYAFDNGLLTSGLHPSLTYMLSGVTELTFEPSLIQLGNRTASVAELRETLAREDLALLLELEGTYMQPQLTTVIKALAAKTGFKLERTQNAMFIVMVLSVSAYVLCYVFFVAGILRNLDQEVKHTRSLLVVIPEDVVDNLQQLQDFLVTQFGDDQVRSQQRARKRRNSAKKEVTKKVHPKGAPEATRKPAKRNK